MRHRPFSPLSRTTILSLMKFCSTHILYHIGIRICLFTRIVSKWVNGGYYPLMHIQCCTINDGVALYLFNLSYLYLVGWDYHQMKVWCGEVLKVISFNSGIIFYLHISIFGSFSQRKFLFNNINKVVLLYPHCCLMHLNTLHIRLLVLTVNKLIPIYTLIFIPFSMFSTFTADFKLFTVSVAGFMW